MELSGARILLECLVREGVEHIFGFPGATVLEWYDTLRDYPGIRHVLVRHEQGAVHAADGYARASGKVGVVMVTSGPGATNTVTGLATANADSSPLVVFTGQVPTALIGDDAFQEADITGITRPCTKHNYVVQRVEDLASIVRQAFFIARTGRPGPVLVDLPKDVLQAVTEFEWPETIHMRGYNPNFRPNTKQLRRAVDELECGSAPLLFVGGGVVSSGASELVRSFAHAYGIPVTSTLMGLGTFPADDPLFLGMIGMHGTYAANMAASNCDVLIAVGVRFDDRVTGRLNAFAPKATIIHIDIDPTSLQKTVGVTVPLVADCAFAIETLMHTLRNVLPDAAREWPERFRPWNETLAEWKKAHPIAYAKTEPGAPIKPQEVIQTVHAITNGNAVITTEVGQHQMWTAQFYPFTKPRTLITSGGLGTMGFGLPAAMGVQTALPEATVVDISGDGSFLMNMQEMVSICANRLPVKVLILNNRSLGMVRQFQHLFLDRRYAAVDLSAQPDFMLLAQAFGAEGYRITDISELTPRLTQALTSPNPAIIEVVTDVDELVYPIVPAGAALDEMLLG